MILPDAILDAFGEDPETGRYAVRIYSATTAREIERTLAEAGISYQTRIVRSRKRGIYYQIILLEDVDG